MSARELAIAIASCVTAARSDVCHDVTKARVRLRFGAFSMAVSIWPRRQSRSATVWAATSVRQQALLSGWYLLATALQAAPTSRSPAIRFPDASPARQGVAPSGGGAMTRRRPCWHNERHERDRRPRGRNRCGRRRRPRSGRTPLRTHVNQRRPALSLSIFVNDVSIGDNARCREPRPIAWGPCRRGDVSSIQLRNPQPVRWARTICIRRKKPTASPGLSSNCQFPRCW
jgi:hypothetical protein